MRWYCSLQPKHTAICSQVLLVNGNLAGRHGQKKVRVWLSNGQESAGLAGQTVLNGSKEPPTKRENTMINSNMSKILAAAALLIATSNIAGAAELLSPLHYGDELDRCVAEIRAELAPASDTRMRHSIFGIEKSGAWYTFAIQSEVLSADDSISATATSQCSANRFDATTRVDKLSIEASADAQMAQSR
jgi:hypothetical protein